MNHITMNHIKSISKLLIANRGEIAVRVITTCRLMNIKSVAVFSDADRYSKFVDMADEAYHLGGSEARESYLNGAKIMEIAKSCGANAIHPGYGFLSENAEFSQLCTKNDIIFVGPNPKVVQQMGSKIESKKIALECNVPSVPGYFGSDQNSSKLYAEAQKIGVPILIKASAGGGGRGMRVVTDITQFEEQLSLAQNEAQSAFGDAQVLLERYITEPRHLEVQILGDKHGHVVHFYERECSVQRHHQKVIEEAPAAHLDESVREQLFDYALTLAKYIGYDSVGTVEFIIDQQSQDVFFLEMNTRLQVEHPVTELITDVDLVKWQILVASNHALTFEQSDVKQQGWAIEARVTAEDPSQSYQPQIGTLSRYQEPRGPGIRVDSGIRVGSEITPYYDSMISKTIAFGDNRAQARARLIGALKNYTISGVKSNLGFLIDLLELPEFISQPLTTQYIESHYPDGWQDTYVSQPKHFALAALAVLYRQRQQNLWQQGQSWRLLRNAGQQSQNHLTFNEPHGAQTRVVVKFFDQQCVVDVIDSNEEAVSVEVETINCSHQSIAAQLDGQYFSYEVYIDKNAISLFDQGHSLQFDLVPKSVALHTQEEVAISSDGTVNAPIPGVISEVKVTVGQHVKAGEVVVTLEAMKLIHKLTATKTGSISTIHCEAGMNVMASAPLIEIEEDVSLVNTEPGARE